MIRTRNGLSWARLFALTLAAALLLGVAGLPGAAFAQDFVAYMRLNTIVPPSSESPAP